VRKAYGVGGQTAGARFGEGRIIGGGSNDPGPGTRENVRRSGANLPRLARSLGIIGVGW
jgi:hypothetical protein